LLSYILASFFFFKVGRALLGLVSVQPCEQEEIHFWECCIFRASDSCQVQKVTVLSAFYHQHSLIEMGCKLYMVLSVLWNASILNDFVRFEVFMVVLVEISCWLWIVNEVSMEGSASLFGFKQFMTPSCLITANQ